MVELPGGLAALAHPWVLAASGFMFCVEFFADKIPGVDTLWDTVHTFIRIPAGAALAASVFGDSSAAATLAAAILGGSLAAGSHFAKAGSRAVINTSPEPFSNWAASFGEELAVGTVLWLAFAHPIAALVVLGAAGPADDLADPEGLALHPGADRARSRGRPPAPRARPGRGADV